MDPQLPNSAEQLPGPGGDSLSPTWERHRPGTGEVGGLQEPPWSLPCRALDPHLGFLWGSRHNRLGHRPLGTDPIRASPSGVRWDWVRQADPHWFYWQPAPSPGAAPLASKSRKIQSGSSVPTSWTETMSPSVMSQHSGPGRPPCRYPQGLLQPPPVRDQHPHAPFLLCPALRSPAHPPHTRIVRHTITHHHTKSHTPPSHTHADSHTMYTYTPSHQTHHHT